MTELKVPSDSAILSKLAVSPNDAKSEWYARDAGAVFAFILSFLARNASREDALSILHDTFLRAFKGVGQFRGQSELKTWTIAIAKHAAIDFYRRKANAPASAAAPLEQLQDGQLEEALLKLGRNAEDPTLHIEQIETIQEVKILVDALPKRHREVIVLRIFGEMSVFATSQVLGISVPATKMLLRRALLELRSRLAMSSRPTQASVGRDLGAGQNGK